MKLTNKLAHYGDILAIPFFVITLYYFYQIDNKSWLEVIITMFLTIGLLCDILFTYTFLRNN
jgi:hypothetical protein